MADVGQEEVLYFGSESIDHLSHFTISSQDFEAARKKALAVGAKKFFLEVTFFSF